MIAKEFWEKVDKGGPDECWPWKQSIGTSGYGQVHFSGENVGAHRVAYYLTHRSWPDHCCHSCGNKRCCNPAHLWSGTAADNMRDEHRGLTRDQKGLILSATRAGFSRVDVARCLNVNVRTVFRVLADSRKNRVAIALDLASAAVSDAEARLALPAAIDAAHAELVAAGAPESAEHVVQACLLMANYRHSGGHLSADTCPARGHLSG